MTINNNLLQNTCFTDWQHPSIVAKAKELCANITSDIDKVKAIYLFSRDAIRYDPYHIELNPKSISASLTLARKYGYCIEKALLMSALCRAIGMPTKLGFANVRNHLADDQLIEVLKTDVFVFHGYVAVYINGKWVKATPAFNKELCAFYNVPPLAFDGENDSIFHAFDQNGQQFMEYLHEYGEFNDLPYDLFVTELKRYYGHLLNEQDEPITAGIFKKHPTEIAP